MDFNTLLSLLDVGGTVFLIIYIAKHFETLMGIMAPFVTQIVLSVSEANERRQKECTALIMELIQDIKKHEDNE